MQSQLEQFLEGAASRPYRKLVEHHLKRSSASELMEASLGETALLPEDLQGLVMDYIDETNTRFAYHADFWAHTTCQEAFEKILDVAISVFPLKDRIKSVEDAMKPENHDLAFGLFQMPTINFAYSASMQRDQRKFMGIRKGLFG